MKAWAGAHENYTLTESDGTTTLNIDTDIGDSYADMKAMFEDMWPKSLRKLKEIAEK